MCQGCRSSFKNLNGAPTIPLVTVSQMFPTGVIRDPEESLNERRSAQAVQRSKGV